MPVPHSLRIDDVEVPTMIYGTAWKEDRTATLVETALEAGFRGIDTANQRRHYHEAGVGEAVGAWRRSAAEAPLFIQTKFTYRESQDHRLPYDPRAPYPDQVRQSFASSLEHLGVERIDSLLLHGPRSGRGWSDADQAVWRTMEELRDAGSVSLIGVSNVSATQLELVCRFARVAPAFVQNRCFARAGWDRAVREVCRAQGVVYQGFSLLTANAAELRSRTVEEIARAHDRSVAQVIFRFALEIGMVCLTGTTDRRHMEEDLASLEFDLSAEEVSAIERISG